MGLSEDYRLCIAVGKAVEFLKHSKLDCSYSFHGRELGFCVDIALTDGPNIVFRHEFYDGDKLYDAITWFVLGFESGVSHTSNS